MIVLTGENSFALRAALEKLRTEFVQKHGDFALEQLDGTEATIERLREAMTSLPFLATHKMVVLEQPGANIQFTEAVATIAEMIPETTTVILVEPKLNKGTKYYKWLKSHTDFREHSVLDERGLAAWATEYATQQGSTLGRTEATYLVQRIGLNQIRLSHEIEKLSLGTRKITKDHINELTEPTPQTKIFDLLDAAFSGNAGRALAIYDEQRALKVEPLEIMSMIGWQLRQIALAKTAKGRTVPFSVKKAQPIARALTMAQLRELVAELSRLDVKSKQQTLDLNTALRAYILTVSSTVS